MYKLMKRRITEYYKWFATGMLIISITSCATMFSGTRADIMIDGDVDEPLTILSSHAEYQDVTLPTIVEVKRKHLDGQHIQITSEHHTFDDIVLEKAFNAWALLSVYTGALGCIDLFTNAVSKPKYDNFYITPSDKTADDSLRRPATVTIPLYSSKYRAQLRSKLLPEKPLRHEINGTIGLGINQADHYTEHFINGFTKRYHMEPEGGCMDLTGESYIVGKLEYHYRFDKKWDFGAMMAWGVSNENYDDRNYYYDNEQKRLRSIFGDGYERCTFFSFAPSVRYTWYETPKYRLFSRVALGAMRHHLSFDVDQWENNDPNTSICRLVNEEYYAETKWRMAYQISPIGICVGAHNLKFIAELGYGCLGVLNMGVCVSF